MKKNTFTSSFLFVVLLYLSTLTSIKAQNTNLPVGAIPGIADVSLQGVATYTIPIEVIPGTQGIQPNLSIVYNSLSGMGLLGMKWNLTGLSAITRVPQNRKHEIDGNYITFTASDRLELDGIRLVNIDYYKEYWDNEIVYGMEIENFTRITGYDMHSSPYFIAVTEDGTRIQYGHTADSELKLTYSTYSWLISKITDVNGNYMTFHYSNNKGDVTLRSIEYTANLAAGLTPYAKVNFSYITNTVDPAERYIYGSVPVKQNKLLREITVSYQNQTVRKYQFAYTQNRITRLSTVKLIGENNKELNATQIRWGDEKPAFSYGNMGINKQGDMLAGDFNGDGITDYVLYNMNRSNKIGSWEYYRGNGSGGYIFVTTSTHDELPEHILAADINGDGKDELIIGKKNSDGRTDFQVFEISREGHVSSYYIKYVNDLTGVLLGDFNGNGTCDILFLTAKAERVGNEMKTRVKGLFSGIQQLDIDFGWDVNVQTCDFNGNGKTNIVVLNKNAEATGKWCEIYEYEVMAFKSIYKGGFPTGWHEVYYGDFKRRWNCRCPCLQ